MFLSCPISDFTSKFEDTIHAHKSNCDYLRKLSLLFPISSLQLIFKYEFIMFLSSHISDDITSTMDSSKPLNKSKCEYLQKLKLVQQLLLGVIDQSYDLYLFILLLRLEKYGFAASFLFADLFPAVFIVWNKFRLLKKIHCFIHFNYCKSKQLTIQWHIQKAR